MEKMTLVLNKHKDGLWYFTYKYEGWGFTIMRSYRPNFELKVEKIAHNIYFIELFGIKLPGQYGRATMLRIEDKFRKIIEKYRG